MKAIFAALLLSFIASACGSNKVVIRRDTCENFGPRYAECEKARD